jgi:Tol biopolymer transport system component
VASNGFQTDDISDNPSISADGRFVAFESYAQVLVKRDFNGVTDVFVHDLETRTTVRASVGTSGREANGFSTYPSISADGRFVAFQSFASNLVRDDGNGLDDVFVRDLVGGVTIRVSLDTFGGDPNGASTLVSITGDGSYVAYESLASDLVEGSGDHHEDVFGTRVAL